MLPSEALDAEERAALARLKMSIQDSPEQLAEALAELLIFRRVASTIRANGFLMNHKSVRPLMDKLPGSRFVRGAHLPPYSKR